MVLQRDVYVAWETRVMGKFFICCFVRVWDKINQNPLEFLSHIADIQESPV